MTATTRPCGDFNSTPALDYEAWRVLLQSLCGRYSPVGADLSAFTGSVKPRNILGCAAVDLSCNAHRVERTHRDVRLDGMEHYYAVFQLAGRSTMIQNDRVSELAVGDVALVDSSRPVTYFPQNRARWLSLHLPRRSLTAQLGMKLEGGVCRPGGTLAGGVLSRLVRDAVNERDPSSGPVERYMQFAIYDLVGALFAESDLPAISSHTGKLFERVCAIIRDRFADPDFGPCEAAAEAGISLRYLQKLFTARSSTCTHFMHSVRLDHAARLLHRRTLLGTGQPISDIAYASGFSDYTNFARMFRRRFGHAPGAHAGDPDQLGRHGISDPAFPLEARSLQA